MDTTYEERSIWVQLVSLVVIFGGYLVVAGIMMAADGAAGEEQGVPIFAYIPLFTIAVILLVIVLTLGHIGAMFFGLPEKTDERDRLINWRADSYASHILGGGVLIGITGMVFGLDTVWVAHFLFLCLLLTEIVKLVLQLVFYKRGV